MVDFSDFTGFSFGNEDSEDLGITRVSGGDRYNEELFPEIKDKTAEIPGLDGEYFFGSNYGSKKIDIEFAFDSLDEGQFRKLRQVFASREIKPLIFNERPYKTYMAKIESPIELSYVCFDEPKRRVVGKAVGDERYGPRVINRTYTTETVIDEETGESKEITTVELERERIEPYEIEAGTQRIYKGEGKATFVCYYPFAKSTFKVLPQSGDKYYEGSEDWAISSGLLSANERVNLDTFDSESGIINIYNGGDLPTGFRLYIPSAAVGNDITLTYISEKNSQESSILKIKSFNLKDGDIGVLIDTNNQLIVGVSSFNFNGGDAVYDISGNLYNEYVDSGYFFKFVPNEKTDEATLEIAGSTGDIKIFYDYLYF